jgi:hypothetical protein
MGRGVDGAAYAEGEPAEMGFRSIDLVELAGLGGFHACGLDRPSQFQAEFRQLGQHLRVAGSVLRGRRCGGRHLCPAGGVVHLLMRT